MRKYLVLTILIALPSIALSAALNSRDADVKVPYEPIVDAFFQELHEGKTQQAVSELFSTNPWVTRNPDLLDSTTSGLDGISKQVGKYHGRQFLVEKAVAGRFVQVNYLVLYDRQPVEFGFQFYMPHDTWFTFGLSYIC